MSSMISKIVIFITGAALGSVVTWKLLQKKYDEMLNEEMRSFKKEMREMKEQHNEKIETLNTTIKNMYEDTIQETTSKHYRGMLDDLDYTNDELEPKPYVISPEEVGNTDEDYDLISLNYYEDGVLADDWDEPIEDVERVVGKDSLNHFGEYEDDSVYVRNDRLKCEYEILLRAGKFADVIRDKIETAEAEVDREE